MSIRLLFNHPHPHCSALGHTFSSRCQFVENLSKQPKVSPELVPDRPPPALADLPYYIFDLLVRLRINMKPKIANLLSLKIAPVICSVVDPLPSGKWRLKEAGERGEGATFSQTNQFCTGEDIFLMA